MEIVKYGKIYNKISNSKLLFFVSDFVKFAEFEKQIKTIFCFLS